MVLLYSGIWFNGFGCRYTIFNFFIEFSCVQLYTNIYVYIYIYIMKIVLLDRYHLERYDVVDVYVDKMPY